MARLRAGNLRNGVLGTLTHTDIDALVPYLVAGEIEKGDVLYDVGQQSDKVHFIESGLLSKRVRIDEPLEIALLGRCDIVGISGLLNGSDSISASVAETPSKLFSIRTNDLRAVFAERPRVSQKLLHYVQVYMCHVSTNVFCGIEHTLEQRLAKWLLLAAERQDDDILEFSHEHLSRRLAVRRAGVTVALKNFEELGCVSQLGYKSIRVADSKKLSSIACSCYQRIFRAYAAILP